ncbi:putative transcriptional regulatory protein [Escovopsis weberi]|uniref:Putative transcriptional regulatory protein n=1 Tax=Escovopsis weberi TaxID=150374 RepID=A0A0M9VU83_ESCWE|nr:putative transcriptional regulatory protein [Escovopsis weberi]
MSGPSSHGGSVSPRQAAPAKNVAFELLFLDSPQCRARLPMRVQIFPHDTTDSIVTTVKNFYGLYSGPTGSKGVSFEDEHGNTLIARYENFRNNMVVYVRVIEEPPVPTAAMDSHHYQNGSVAPDSYYRGEGYGMQQRMSQDMGRPTSRSSRRRSQSPGATRGRRSDSTSTNGKKGRSRSTKNRAGTSQGHGDAYADSANGYSSGDNAPSTASGKTKDQIGTMEISVENIVEGGRRKRAKFESSSYSSAHNRSGMYSTPASDRHGRGSISYSSNGMSSSMSILPTPDPTVGSCMSEEDKDVAIQLMRLGELSNISHGRTSASTLDDAFSGRAEVASSIGATSEGDSDSDGDDPPPRRQKSEMGVFSRQIYQTTESHFMPPFESTEVSGDDADYEDGVEMEPKSSANKPKSKSSSSTSKSGNAKASKAARLSNGSKSKKGFSVSNGPMSPTSISHSRKQSIVSNSNMPLAGEEEQPDLSTKPRCQRCRKSKKGCDRQRPCGRCRDAGLSADQCISEDEGNGRKGRYGRHMGVPVKKEDVAMAQQPALLPAAPIAISTIPADKAKKRKR